ncbi:prolyl oligopeptidase family serine peptidase [Mesorhizobium intechi]|uniref:Prolyl oligopeptidase family serine peptidase n=1 Tax=Mesorhizobium intechi TaxID=537601 RepID=A0A8T9AUB9_9HYPH|nr:dienelactone hydrolase family protein [Mesorhizobium intechi]TSE11672.1 prolyl oligopeptidase family serine peptidase [Mesorhizobium intechi]
MDRGLVILLHGVGSNGANMAALGRALAPALPGVIFESPDAPGGRGPHREWFSVVGVTEANRQHRVVAARPGFDAVIAKIIERHGFSNALDRVALLGFSQGAIMALDALANGRWPVGAVIAFSGRLASPAPLAPATGTPLLLIHGGADPVMPSSESVRAAEQLTAAGVRARISIEPSLGHQVSNTGLAVAARFLNDVLT